MRCHLARASQLDGDADGARESRDANAIKEVEAAYALFCQLDILDMSTEGAAVLEAAKRRTIDALMQSKEKLSRNLQIVLALLEPRMKCFVCFRDSTFCSSATASGQQFSSFKRLSFKR